MPGRGEYKREQVPSPKCGNRVQRQYMRKHDKNMHQTGRRRVHVCPYCSADKVKTYSTFADWKNHLGDTHQHCMAGDNPLLEAGYAAGFKLDSWGRLHELDGIDTDPAYKCIKTLQASLSQRQYARQGRDPHGIRTGGE